MLRYKKALLILLLVVAVATAVALPVAATEFAEGATLDEDEVIDDDLFISGNLVYINGTVTGNVVASGGQVVVNGEIGGSLVTAAQTIMINGTIEGSAYGASASMELGPSASVGRNLYYAGYSLTTQPNAEVGQDLLTAVYQFIHNGSVGRDARADAGAADIAGAVGRDLVVDLGDAPASGTAPSIAFPGAPPSIAPGLRVASGAQIGGVVRYISPSDEGISINAEPGGGVRHVQTAQPDESEGEGDQVLTGLAAFGLAVLRWLYGRAKELVTLLLLGALGLWLLRSRYLGVVDVAADKPVESAGWGLLTTIGGYVAFVVAAIIIVVAGIALAVVSLGGLTGSFFAIALSCLVALFILFLFAVKWASKLVLIYLVGRAILRSISPKEQGIGWPLVIGSLIYVVLRAIPVVGGLLALIVTLVGMGALAQYVSDLLKGEPAPAETVLD
jgi:cytoskeletal protein CcmA (bactofilin family)